MATDETTDKRGLAARINQLFVDLRAQCERHPQGAGRQPGGLQGRRQPAPDTPGEGQLHLQTAKPARRTRPRVQALEERGTAYQQFLRRCDQELFETYAAKLSAADMQEIESALEKLKRVFED
ncbi:hypothetical protein [Streptomyces sp. 769]|uniref:hypothetical protein n=1 Tax=Streptomyces sp. 769 TaxID=1262452 RepID=UPI001EF04A44|nr:hypothetical protein [Streptomyces sp. 769]